VVWVWYWSGSSMYLICIWSASGICLIRVFYEYGMSLVWVMYCFYKYIFIFFNRKFTMFFYIFIIYLVLHSGLTRSINIVPNTP